jgi:DNA-binding transcriptional MerR regulator
MSQRFTVKAVAQKTGINPHTIRIWERRFSVITPERTETGRRQYTRADIEKLTLIKRLTDSGHAISNVAAMTFSELMEAAQSPAPATDDKDPGPDAGGEVDQIVESLEHFRLRDVNIRLALARSQMSVRAFVLHVISPLLGRIGMRVDQNQLSIAHEHTLSALLKTHIYEYYYSMSLAQFTASRDNEAPTLTIATQEGDFHEFGILLASLLAVSRGVRIHFLGCNMPADSLGFAANALRTKVVLVGRTVAGDLPGPGNIISQKRWLKLLDQSLRSEAEIWVGGHLEAGAEKMKLRRPLRHISSLIELDSMLEDLKKK